MSAEYPQSVEEWATYIAGLSGVSLRDKAIAANTLQFIEDLQEEGYSPSDITDILVLFALQFVVDGQAPAHGIPDEYLSFPDLLEDLGKDVR